MGVSKAGRWRGSRYKRTSKQAGKQVRQASRSLPPRRAIAKESSVEAEVVGEVSRQGVGSEPLSVTIWSGLQRQ